MEIAPRSCRMSSAAIVDGRIRLSANARSSGTAGFRWWQTISMSRCSSTVLTVCGRVGLVDDGSTLGCRGDGDDVRRVPAARALGVVGVDRPAGDRPQRVLDEAGLVQRVGVDRDLHARPPPTRQAGVDRGRRGAPVLVQLEPGRAGPQLLPQRLGRHGVALAEQHDVDRPGVDRLEHPGQVPRARGDRGRLGALGRAGAAADQRGDAAAERLGELRADQVHVAVDAAGGEDPPVAGDASRWTARSPGPGGRRPWCRGCRPCRSRRSGRRGCRRRP